MFVCICNGYRSADLQELAKAGVRSAEEAYRSLGAGPRCGQCIEVAQQLIDGAHVDGAQATAGERV